LSFGGEWQSDTATYDYDSDGNRTYTREKKYAAMEEFAFTDWALVNGRQWYSADDKLMAYSTAMDSIKTTPTFGVYNEHEEYWYDALGRRILTRVQRGAGCSRMNRTSGCRSEVARTIWDGDQILGEIKTLGESPELEGGSGAHFGKVAYVHGGGIDKPLELVRMNYGATTVAIPHENFRGLFDSGTCLSGGIPCDQIEWPAALASAYMELSRSDTGETNWFGNLIAGKSDASGLMYMRNRYMDPKTGTFTQSDPLGLGGGLNVYGYANGDPVSFSDPFGLCPEIVDGKPCGVSFAGFTFSASWLTGVASVSVGKFSGQGYEGIYLTTGYGAGLGPLLASDPIKMPTAKSFLPGVSATVDGGGSTSISSFSGDSYQRALAVSPPTGTPISPTVGVSGSKNSYGNGWSVSGGAATAGVPVTMDAQWTHTRILTITPVPPPLRDLRTRPDATGVGPRS
jgi:RHS repeat-associated protein